MNASDTAIIQLPNATELQTAEPVFEIDNHRYEIPALFTQGGERGMYFFVEFFSASIENPHTRRAYVNAVLRFARWCEKGLWQRMHEHFADDPDLESIMIDSSVVRAHPCAAGAPQKKGAKRPKLWAGVAADSVARSMLVLMLWAILCDLF